MKLNDIVEVLQNNLPMYTDLFSNRVNIVDIAVEGVTTTLTLDPSQTYSSRIKSNDKIFVKNVRLKNPIIDVVTEFLDDETCQVTVTTAEDHDLVQSNIFQRGNDQYFIEVVGLNPVSYNGSFPLVPGSVPNRYTFTYIVKTADAFIGFSDAYIIQPPLTDNFFQGYQAVTTNVNGELTYNLLIQSESAPQYIPFADENTYFIFNIRISASVSLDLFSRWYSKQPPNNYWLCVVPADTRANKDFRIESDATQTVGAGVDPRQRLITQFVLYVFAPFPQDSDDRTMSNHVSGRLLYDGMQDLFVHLLKSFVGKTLPSQLSEIPWSRITTVGHGQETYDNAIYVYQYTFEISVDATAGDFFDNSYPTRAFRDLYARYLSQEPYDSAILATFGLNLDEDAP
jgi:hypothetical protein